MLLVLRTGGFAVGRYLPVIASLPEGKDAKEVIKEATKVCFDFYTTSGVNLNCRSISRSRQGWRPLKYLTREVSSSLLKGKVMIVPMFLLREQCGYQPVLANLLSKTMYYIAVDPYPPKRFSLSSRTENREPKWVATPTRTQANASLPAFPIDKMFEDERYWYPHFFVGRRVIGRVEYSAPENPDDIVGRLNRYWFGFTD